MKTNKIKLHSQQSLTEKLGANQQGATQKDAVAQNSTQWAAGGFAGA